MPTNPLCRRMLRKGVHSTPYYLSSFAIFWTSNQTAIGPGSDDLNRLVDRGQRAVAQQIDLHQADRLGGVLVVLRDDDALVRPLQGRDLAHRSRRDHDPAAMDAQMSRNVHQLLRQPVDRRGLFDLALPGQLVDLLGRQTQGPADVANRAAKPVPIDVADHRDMLETPVLVAEADHLIAPAPAQVDVDIGTIGPAGIHETLEIEPILDGTDPREAQHVGDQRAGGRAAHLDRNIVSLGEVDDLMDHQEIVAEAVLAHGRQLVFQPLDDLVTGGTVSLGKSQVTKPGQFPVAGGPVGELDPGQDRLALEQLEAAPLDEPIRVRQRPGTATGISARLPSPGQAYRSRRRPPGRRRPRSTAVSAPGAWQFRCPCPGASWQPVQAIGSTPRQGRPRPLARRDIRQTDSLAGRTLSVPPRISAAH